jgi:UDPglucose--hexose-1-phosphate uridylyltransferase
MWQRPFPYLMAVHQAPLGGDAPYAHMHIEFSPPYRTKDRLKFLAGTELAAGMFASDSLPEDKAKELKAVTIPSF